MLIIKTEYEQVNKRGKQYPKIEVRVVETPPQRQRHQKEPLYHLRGKTLAQWLSILAVHWKHLESSGNNFTQLNTRPTKTKPL